MFIRLQAMYDQGLVARVQVNKTYKCLFFCITREDNIGNHTCTGHSTNSTLYLPTIPVKKICTSLIDLFHMLCLNQKKRIPPRWDDAFRVSANPHKYGPFGKLSKFLQSISCVVHEHPPFKVYFMDTITKNS